MYIINLTYVQSLNQVEKFLPEHKLYLDKYYAKNKFICSGRKNPRTGGIILCKANNIIELNTILHEDPFFREKIATYDVIEFEPSKASNTFLECLKK